MSACIGLSFRRHGLRNTPLGVPTAGTASAPPAPAPVSRVLLVDDHDLVRAGLRSIIDSDDEMCVVGEAADGAEAIALALELQPDVIVMDVRMPRLDGIAATREIKRTMPEVTVIGLSLDARDDVRRSMVDAGASELFLKGSDLEALCLAIRSTRMASC